MEEKTKAALHSLEFRPRVKKPALIVIGIDVYDLAVMCKRIVCQQKPLILDATGRIPTIPTIRNRGRSMGW